MLEGVETVNETRGPSQTRAGKYLTFELADESYGLEILKVREIMGIMSITAVPRTPHFVKGVINLRGKVIPVVDQAECLDAHFGRIGLVNVFRPRSWLYVGAEEREGAQTQLCAWSRPEHVFCLPDAGVPADPKHGLSAGDLIPSAPTCLPDGKDLLLRHGRYNRKLCIERMRKAAYSGRK